MTDIVDGTDETPTTVDEAIVELQSIGDAVGPRRVKTKDMEIESHPIDKLQMIQERNSPKPVGLNQMRYDIVRPRTDRCYRD